MLGEYFGEAWGGNAWECFGEAWGGLGKVWGMLGECFGEAWGMLLSVLLCASLRLSGLLWASLGLSGPLWASLGLSGPFWASLGLSEASLGRPGGLLEAFFRELGPFKKAASQYVSC